MYNHHLNHLGETPAEPTFWDKLVGTVQTGVTASFNIYDKVRQLQTATQTRRSAEDLARQIVQVQPPVGAPGGPPMPAPVPMAGGMDWTMPLIVGIGALGLVMFMRR